MHKKQGIFPEVAWCLRPQFSSMICLKKCGLKVLWNNGCGCFMTDSEAQSV